MNKIKAVINNSPWVIAAIYVIAGFWWIEISDQVVLTSLADPGSITEIQSLKGWLYVAASGLLIFLLVRKSNRILGSVINELQTTNNKFKATIENAPVGIAHHLPDEKWIEANKSLCKILGYSRDELMTLDFSDFIHPDDLQKGRELDRRLAAGEIETYKTEKKFIRKDGSQLTGKVRKSAVMNGGTQPIYLIVVVEDITKQKESEKLIQRSLEEKEILLAEVHHRVKNNLALISAFLELEGMYNQDKSVGRVLNKNQLRIKCLAMIHETFARCNNTEDIQFGEFLHQFLAFLNSRFRWDHSAVDIRKKILPVQLNINAAIPVSLFLLELLCHITIAVSGLKAPVIGISLHEHLDKVTLKICHSASQTPEKDGGDNSDSLPFTLIHTLVSQVDGKLETTHSHAKNTFTLLFKKKSMTGSGSGLYHG